MTELEEKRARLAAVDRELSRLGLQHELAMSAFKFDKASDVQQRIAVLERERGELVDALPAPAEPPATAPEPERIWHRRLTQRRRRPLRR
jgi:hypothetical protein